RNVTAVKTCALPIYRATTKNPVIVSKHDSLTLSIPCRPHLPQRKGHTFEKCAPFGFSVELVRHADGDTLDPPIVMSLDDRCPVFRPADRDNQVPVLTIVKTIDLRILILITALILDGSEPCISDALLDPVDHALVTNASETIQENIEDLLRVTIIVNIRAANLAISGLVRNNRSRAHEFQPL